MISWICSYPRSGSAWTRHTLERQFAQPVCFGRAGNYEWYVGKLCENLQFTRNDEDSVAVGLTSAHGRMVWVLKDALGAVRDPSLRQQLAADPRHFYIRTHAPAFRNYSKEERLFFMVRHPMAAFTSYKRFLLKMQNVEVALEDLIAGRGVKGLDYIAYTERLLERCASDSRHLVVRYEDKHTDYSKAIQLMETFVGIPAATPVDAAPTMYRDPAMQQLSRARMTSWVSEVPAHTLALFESRFGGLMARLGYRMPTDDDRHALEHGQDVALVTASPFRFP